MTLTVPDLLEQLGLADEIACDRVECERAAAWWLICRHCNRHTALCGPHVAVLDGPDRHTVRRFFGLLVEVHIHVFECSGCGAQALQRSWREHYFVIPIDA